MRGSLAQLVEGGHGGCRGEPSSSRPHVYAARPRGGLISWPCDVIKTRAPAGGPLRSRRQMSRPGQHRTRLTPNVVLRQRGFRSMELNFSPIQRRVVAAITRFRGNNVDRALGGAKAQKVPLYYLNYALWHNIFNGNGPTLLGNVDGSQGRNIYFYVSNSCWYKIARVFRMFCLGPD